MPGTTPEKQRPKRSSSLFPAVRGAQPAALSRHPAEYSNRDPKTGQSEFGRIEDPKQRAIAASLDSTPSTSLPLVKTTKKRSATKDVQADASVAPPPRKSPRTQSSANLAVPSQASRLAQQAPRPTLFEQGKTKSRGIDGSIIKNKNPKNVAFATFEGLYEKYQHEHITLIGHWDILQNLPHHVDFKEALTQAQNDHRYFKYHLGQTSQQEITNSQARLIEAHVTWVAAEGEYQDRKKMEALTNPSSTSDYSETETPLCVDTPRVARRK